MDYNTIKGTNQAIDVRVFTEAEIKAMDSKGFYTLTNLAILSGIPRGRLYSFVVKGILPARKMTKDNQMGGYTTYVVLAKDWEDFKKSDEYLYCRAIVEREGATRKSGDFTLNSLASYVGWASVTLSSRKLVPSFIFQSALGDTINIYKLEDYLRFCKKKGYLPYGHIKRKSVKKETNAIKNIREPLQVKVDNDSVGSVLELLPADDKPSVASKTKELPSWLKIPADTLINEVDKMPLQEISNCIPKEVIFKELVEAVGEDKLRNLVFLRKLQETK